MCPSNSEKKQSSIIVATDQQSRGVLGGASLMITAPSSVNLNTTANLLVPRNPSPGPLETLL